MKGDSERKEEAIRERRGRNEVIFPDVALSLPMTVERWGALTKKKIKKT